MGVGVPSLGVIQRPSSLVHEAGGMVGIVKRGCQVADLLHPRRKWVAWWNVVDVIVCFLVVVFWWLVKISWRMGLNRMVLLWVCSGSFRAIEMHFRLTPLQRTRLNDG